ncbi:MAG: lamin tail domain-containing protein [Clostridia bacterium]|nr:lamin tail domain-containing protein [Clostridia bacterium]
MQQMPPVRRGGGRTGRNEQAPVKRKKKSRKGIILALAAFVALLALIVMISPKEAVTRAHFTTGTQSGQVEEGLGTTGSLYEGLVISEVMSSNRTAVPDENGEYADWIEIWNSSDRAINIANVGLSDRNDSIRFLFPDMVLESGGRAIVFCSDTNAAEVGSNFHAKFKLSSVGETVYLFDPNAYEIDSVTLPIMSSDESYALMADGSYAATGFFSPGYVNGEAGNEQYRNETMAQDGTLVISEIMPDALTGLADEDGELVDWMELYNTTDKPISLDNYALSNKENKPLRWRFPKGAVVAPHSYYVVFCSGKDRSSDASAVPHADFRISAEKDTIILSDSHGRLVDRVMIDNIPEDCSYARNADGSFSVHQMATPGLDNTQAGADRMDQTLRAMNPIGVYITEVMASNDATLVYQDAECTDWIEIYNSSSRAQDLSGYGLSDNLGRARKWQFPQGTVIQPGEYKVILCDSRADLSITGQLHTSFSLTQVGGYSVSLCDPTGKVLDKVIMPEVPTNVSYGRTIGLSGFFYYDAPTPLAANGTGFLGYAETPSFIMEPGMYYATVYTGFNVPENTTVYYTKDGSIPTRSSIMYTPGEYIEMNFTGVLRARAFSDTGLEPSKIITGSYFVNAYHTLPIVSLTCDPEILWNKETGMLVTGDHVVKVAGELPFEDTIYRWVKENMEPAEGYLEYYLLDGTQMLSQGVDMSLMGQFSLDMPQKSFKIRAKARYGQSTFQAALFEDRPYTEYKSIVLRNSGNDSAWTRLLDGFQSRLMDSIGTQVIHQAWNPVVVYLNGIYWGHMNMRERVDRYFVAQHEGLPLEEADNMDILEASGTVNWGSNKAYRAMVKKIKAGDPAKNEADRQYIEDNIDIENHLEYMALEMFFGNSDIGNTRFYRLHREGSKWKWIIYDLDYGLFNSSFNSPRSYTKAKGMGQMNIDNTIFLKILSVPEWKDMFLQKLGYIFQTFTTEYMLAELDKLIPIIEPEMNMHFARWAEEHDKMVIAEWPTTVDGAYRYWEQRITRLQNTLKKRPNLLWTMVKEELNVSEADMLKYFGPQPEMPDDVV